MYPKESKTGILNKNLYISAQSSAIHNCQREETTQMSISRWMDEMDGMSIQWNIKSTKKTGADENQKHAKWKTPDTEAHIVWFYLCEVSRIGKSVVAARGWGGEMGVNANGCGLFLWCDENVETTLRWWLNNWMYWIVHSKMVEMIYVMWIFTQFYKNKNIEH